MRTIDSKTLDLLWHDADAREDRLRAIVEERIADRPPPMIDDQIVATYFFAFRTHTLAESVAEIAYHATSGTKTVPPGSLLEQCTATAAGIDAWDTTGRLGLLSIAFPLKMMLQPDGHLTSVDLMHTAANAVIFDMYEAQDARLVDLRIPDRVVRTFPGPAYGPKGLRERTGFAPDQPAFGTILKPTAGITPDLVGELVEQAARCPLFLFVKEDENLYPNLDYSPVVERTRRAVAGIERARADRGGLDLIFAPHITGAPHEILDTVHAVVEAGATGVMFSESFAGGIVRMVREATRSLARPPAIYGHNAGICVKTRGIWREVIDLLARLDGIDFRQTAPLLGWPTSSDVGATIRETQSRPHLQRRWATPPYIRPYGAEWRASEAILTKPIDGIRPTMIARAGGLDQGNIGPNLADVEARGLTENVLFLAGSAINSIKDDTGKPNPELGAEAMQQALDVHRSRELGDTPIDEYVPALAAHAEQKKLRALREALRQRYPQKAG